MSDIPSSSANSYSADDMIRPLSVRLHDSVRAQLDVLAQLNGRSVTEEVRLALEAWVTVSRSNPRVLERAEAVRADIEREAEVRRQAILSIFDQEPPKPGRGRPKATRAE